MFYDILFLVIIIAEKIVSGGDSLAKINGKAVFVPQLLPGEKAEIEITESHKDYDRGKVIKILESSPVRREPPCPYYGKCGGCNLQIAGDEAQKQIRLQILQDCFRRALRLGAEDKSSEAAKVVYGATVVSGENWGYRNRFQFHSGGLKRKAQESIIALDDCPVAVPEVRELLKVKKLPERYGRLHVFNGNVAEESEFSPRNGSASWSSNRRDSHRHDENEDIQETSVEICGKQIFFDVRGFFQSNIGAFQKAIEAIKPIVAKYADKAKARHTEKSAQSENTTKASAVDGTYELLDMYAGVGTFSALLGDMFSKTTLVEHNKKALRFTDKNLGNIPHDVYAMTGEKWVRTPSAQKKFNAVIIDPPRSGIEKPVMNWLCAEQRGKRPDVIFSVSCDPVTHARDAALLTAAGYKMTTLMMLDFYPQTSHIESFAVFEAGRS